MTTENTGSTATAEAKPKKLTGAAAASAARAAAKAEEKEPSIIPANLHTVLMVNLVVDGNRSRDLATNEKHFRKNFTAAGEAVNVFSPFSKADKKSAPGLVRMQFPGIVDLLDKMNSDQKVMIATEEQIKKFYGSLLQRAEDKVREMLVPPTLALVAVAEGEAESELSAVPATEQVAEFIEVNSWLAFSPSGDMNEVVVGTICITLYVPKVTDPFETIQRLLRKNNSNLSILLVNTITTDAEAQDPSLLAAKVELAAANERFAYSKAMIEENPQGFVWLPPQGQSNLLASANALCYITHISSKTPEVPAE